MGDLALWVSGLGKQYRLGVQQERYATLRDQVRKWASASLRTLVRRAKRGEKRPPFWALKDVSFEVNRGEVVGVIGRNGAGKSTLLKILSRITEPTEGEVDIHGRVGSLLEVGTGFHAELTGRENVFLNGAILGMRRSETARKFDEIVAFSEVEKFIDTPVKFYSSGMYTRLAFAVAAHLEPEILIVDEVLAVGDAQFQKKCLGKMGEVARGGRTVLFVSHNMQAVKALCTRGVVLDRGRLVFDGPTDRVLAEYAGAGLADQTGHWRRPEGKPPSRLHFTHAAARVEGDQPVLRLVLDLRLAGDGRHAPGFVAVDILDEIGVAVMQALPTTEGVITPDRRDHAIRVAIDLPPLIPGRYAATLWVGPHNTETYDAVEAAVWFEVETSPTPGRTFPHTRDHGWVVPGSSVERVEN